MNDKIHIPAKKIIPEGQEVVIVIGEELNEERIQQYF